MEINFEELEKQLKEGIVQVTYTNHTGATHTADATSTPIHKNFRMKPKTDKHICFYNLTEERWVMIYKKYIKSVGRHWTWEEPMAVELKPTRVEVVRRAQKKPNAIARFFEKLFRQNAG